jgi:hypothetical protein
METKQLEVGRRYAMRLHHRRVNQPVVQAEVVAKVGRGGKVKVRRFGSEHEGLEEYVGAVTLLWPWRRPPPTSR